jgi:hypothetical protein
MIFSDYRDRDNVKGLTIRSLSKNNEIVFNFTYMKEKVTNDSFDVDDLAGSTPVSLVSILHIYKRALILCEVILYGDNVCEPSRYGRECEHTCECGKKNRTCFVSTGKCPIKQCEFGKYGDDCNLKCSQFCVLKDSFSSPCDPIDGECLNGCELGYEPPNCIQHCGFKKFGDGCTFNCTNCLAVNNLKSPCSHLNGICRFGCDPGYDQTVAGLVILDTLGKVANIPAATIV